jgi:hypothetical protein
MTLASSSDTDHTAGSSGWRGVGVVVATATAVAAVFDVVVAVAVAAAVSIASSGGASSRVSRKAVSERLQVSQPSDPITTSRKCSIDRRLLTSAASAGGGEVANSVKYST